MSGFQVIRLASGDTVQVRSGVLQGLGPQGSTGPQGPRGLQGEQGAQGEPGPMGSINAFRTGCVISGSQSVAISTPTNLTFDTTVVDELSLKKSATNFSSDETGDYHASGWVRFSQVADGATGWRQVQVFNTSTSEVLFESQVPAVYNGNTSVPFDISFRVNAGEIVVVRVQHNDNEAVAVSAGSANFYRQGSGPRGLQGIQGEIGPTGATGPQGPAGPTGSAGTGYATIDEMGV